MANVKLWLLALIVAIGVLSAMPANAGGICYRVQVKVKGNLILDRRVGIGCSPHDSQGTIDAGSAPNATRVSS